MLHRNIKGGRGYEKDVVKRSCVLCVICVSTSIAGCANSDSIYRDPRGKVWYNVAELPQVNDPFSEVYDGVYSITVEKTAECVLRPPMAMC